MCGIAGQLLRTGLDVSEADLISMASVIQHRGPDNTGILIKDQCGFAHTRLSLLDLSDAGNQPMVMGNYVLVFNGEIYNFLELRAELEAQNVQFVSTSDTEVLMHMLIRHGVETALKRIRGMFAFAFYDGTSEIVYLCRDRVGIKPLYWSWNQGNLYWASEVKALAQAIPLELDPIQVYYALSSNAEWHHETTLFQGIKSLPPGGYLIGRPGQEPVVCSYYDIADEFDYAYYRELDQLTMDQASQILDGLLKASVDKMLISDAPMGVYLSGGVDSSLITALAIQSMRDLSLFTANVIGRYSEFADAQLVSQHVEMPLYDARFDPADTMEYWAEATWHYEVPIIRHMNAIPFSRVSRLAHEKQVKAVLTGEGSDELFMGYPTLLTKRYDQLLGLPLNIVKKLYSLYPPVRRYIIPSEEESLDGFMNLLAQGFERQRFRENGKKKLNGLPEQKTGDQYLSIQMMKEGIVSLLHRNDRMGMIASIEARFPFLDEDVLHFAVNLPVKFKIGRSRRFHNILHPFLIDKAIVRKVCEPLLPDAITHKRKLGFPMYGHKVMQVAPGYFEGGYVQDLLHMNNEMEDYMIRTQNSYFVAKLASVDVFGRLFAMRESQESITARLKKYVTVKPT